MIFGDDVLLVVLIAISIDYIIGEFPVRHPVVFIGDYIKFFEKIAYKDSVFRGFLLLASLVLVVLLISLGFQFIDNPIIIGILASTGLAGNSLKSHIKNVLYEDDPDIKREKLAGLVTRNSKILDDKRVYSSLIETHSENLSDGYISPLFYLILFGLPGIVAFKAISTLDSMVGYKNERYKNFGKASAICDDVLNYIPARITGVLIWLFGGCKSGLNKIFREAKKYSSSPNAGYPVAAAAHSVEVKVGGTVYYGDVQVNKAEVGEEKTEDYREAAVKFLTIHTKIEVIIILFVIIGVILEL